MLSHTRCERVVLHVILLTHFTELIYKDTRCFQQKSWNVITELKKDPITRWDSQKIGAATRVIHATKSYYLSTALFTTAYEYINIVCN